MPRLAALLVALLISRSAGAGPLLGGTTITVAPDRNDGGFDLWVAGARGALYAGGGLAFDTLSREPGEFTLTYEVLLGARLPLNPWLSLLGDAGLGVTEYVDASLNLLDEDEGMTFDAVRIAARGRLRVLLVAALSRHASLALAATAHSTPTADSTGGGLGIGFVFSR